MNTNLSTSPCKHGLERGRISGRVVYRRQRLLRLRRRGTSKMRRSKWRLLTRARWAFPTASTTCARIRSRWNNGGLRISLMAYLATLVAEPGTPIDASRRSSACSSAGGRCGARTDGPKRCACSRRPTRTRPAPPRERRRLEHAGVPEGVFLPGRRTDGAEGRVPRVVVAKTLPRRKIP